MKKKLLIIINLKIKKKYDCIGSCIQVEEIVISSIMLLKNCFKLNPILIVNYNIHYNTEKGIRDKLFKI